MLVLLIRFGSGCSDVTNPPRFWQEFKSLRIALDAPEGTVLSLTVLRLHI